MDEHTQYIARLFRYDDWANREVLASLRKTETLPEKSMRLIEHIIGTEFTWLARLQGERATLAVWPQLGLDECAAQLDELSVLWGSYLPSLDRAALDRIVRYVNSKGETFESRCNDILTHVVIHSGYHRGQIAANLRAEGEETPNTDFIHAVRQNKIDPPS
ncbi:MAG: DinB family protein [Acidobacteriota bacterium]